MWWSIAEVGGERQTVVDFDAVDDVGGRRRSRCCGEQRFLFEQFEFVVGRQT